MERKMTAGVVVEHAGTRWRIERPLGADAVLLRNDAGEVVSANPLRLRFPPEDPAGQRAARRVDERQYTDAEWAEAAKRRAVLTGLAGLSSRARGDVERAALELGLKRRRVFELLRLAQLGCGIEAFSAGARRSARQTARQDRLKPLSPRPFKRTMPSRSGHRFKASTVRSLVCATSPD